MKLQHILPAIILLPTVAMAATTEPTDTLLNVATPSSIVINETTQGISISVNPLDGGETSTIDIAEYSRGKAISTSQSSSSYFEINLADGAPGYRASSHWSVISSGINIGLVNAMEQPAGYDLSWAKSFEIGWLNAIAISYRYRQASFSLGIGFDWRNYKTTTTSHRFVIDPATGIAPAPYPEGAIKGSSRIKVFSLGIPLLYKQRIPGTTLSFTAGGIFNLNTHASLLTTYTDSAGHSWEEYAEGISRRRVSFDIFGAVTFYKGCGLYVRYSPQSVLRGAGVPQFHPLSVGVTLFL